MGRNMRAKLPRVDLLPFLAFLAGPRLRQNAMQNNSGASGIKRIKNRVQCPATVGWKRPARLRRGPNCRTCRGVRVNVAALAAAVNCHGLGIAGFVLAYYVPG